MPESKDTITGEERLTTGDRVGGNDIKVMTGSTPEVPGCKSSEETGESDDKPGAIVVLQVCASIEVEPSGWESPLWPVSLRKS